FADLPGRRRERVTSARLPSSYGDEGGDTVGTCGSRGGADRSAKGREQTVRIESPAARDREGGAARPLFLRRRRRRDARACDPPRARHRAGESRPRPAPRAPSGAWALERGQGPFAGRGGERGQGETTLVPAAQR